MADPRPTVISILRDDLGYCLDMEHVREYSGLQAAWEEEAPPEFVWWWIEVFVGDPAIVKRMRAAYFEIGRFFYDLERLHRALTGKPIAVPRRLVRALQRRVLNAWFPVSFEVLKEAVGACPEKAAANLMKYTELKEWLECWKKRF